MFNVVIRECVAIFKVLASMKEALPVLWNFLLVLDFGLYVFNSVTIFNIKSDGLTIESLYKNLHTTTYKVKGGFLLNVVVRDCVVIL